MWADALKSIADPKPFRMNGEVVQSSPNVKIGLRSNLKHERRSKHEMQIENAVRHLERLPKAGWSYHCLMRGDYNGWEIVPAVVRLAKPARIEELWVATLGFNERNSKELLELLDAGEVGKVSFICSHYFKATSADIFNPLEKALRSRGQRILAMRCHAKLLLFSLSDGRRLVVESSANLRSCHNIEQFSLTNDSGLYDFHAGWMNEMFNDK